jgi:very-short-patch-repair endonuclease
MTSPLETQFAAQIRQAGLPEPVRELVFHPDRKWRADFCWPEAMVMVEIDGGTWTGGRHTRGKGYAEDICKTNAAQLMGYTALKATGEHIRSGQALGWLSEALERFYGHSEKAA